MQETTFDNTQRAVAAGDHRRRQDFGLSEDETWVVVDGVLYAVGGEATVSEYLRLHRRADARRPRQAPPRGLRRGRLPGGREASARRGILSRNRP